MTLDRMARAVGDAEKAGATATFPSTLQGVRDGARFCGLFPVPHGSGDVDLLSIVSEDGALVLEEVTVGAGQEHFESLSPEIPAAAWYERRAPTADNLLTSCTGRFPGALGSTRCRGRLLGAQPWHRWPSYFWAWCQLRWCSGAFGLPRLVPPPSRRPMHLSHRRAPPRRWSLHQAAR